MITFRCSKDSCEVGFPLKENTKEKVIVCPIKECGKETNVWLKLKRIQVSWRTFSCSGPNISTSCPPLTGLEKAQAGTSHEKRGERRVERGH